MWLKIILAFIVYNTVKSKRLVINTTCLELSDPSNQKFRLSCMNSSDYHCLLDSDSINEYEVCRKWKWISADKCAYFNTYKEGNIDGRPCINSTDFVCPKDLHSSKDNTKYPACYVKITTSTIAPKISSHEVASESSTNVLKEVSPDGMNSTASPISDPTDKQSEIARMTSAVVFGVIIPVLLIAAIFFICRKREKSVALRHKMERTDEDAESQVHQQQNENGSTKENEINNGTLQKKESENDLDEDAEPERQQLMKNENLSTRESGESVALRHELERTNENAESQEHQQENKNGSTRENDEDAEPEQQHIMKNEYFPTRENVNPSLDDKKLPEKASDAISTQET